MPADRDKPADQQLSEVKPTDNVAIAPKAHVEDDEAAEMEDVPESLRDILDAPVVAKAVSAWHEVTSKQVELAKRQSDRAYELKKRQLELREEEAKREHLIEQRRIGIAHGNAWTARIFAGAVLLGIAGLFYLYPSKPEIAIDVAKGVAVLGGAFGAGWAWKKASSKSSE